MVVQVGSSHIGLLGSKEEIAKEKEQIYHHASQKAVLVFNGDNPYTQSMYEKIKVLMPEKRILRFSSKDMASDVFLQLKEVQEDSLFITGHLGEQSFSHQHNLQSIHLFPRLKSLLKSSDMRFAAKRAYSRFALKAELVLIKLFKRGNLQDLHSCDKGAGNRSACESRETFGKHDLQSRDMGAEESRRSVSGDLPLCVPVVGAAHLCNLMAAATVAMAAGMTSSQIWEGLSICRLPVGRNQWVRLKCGARVLFDAYNASAESVMALLDHFLSSVVKGQRILILGDFLEMGSYLEPFHQQLAERLCRYQVEKDSYLRLRMIWFIGSQAKLFGKSMEGTDWLKQNIVSGSEVKYKWNEEVKKLKQNTVDSVPVYLSESDDLYLADKILSVLDPSFVLAFKASRKMRMEKILEQWQPVDFHAL